MREMVKFVDVAIANEEDVQMALEFRRRGCALGQLDREQYRGLAGKYSGQFSNLK